MNPATPAMRNLAGRLIALEETGNPSDETLDGACRVCAKLRAPLAKLAGLVGFRSLLARALALATAEAPSLLTVKVGEDGSLLGGTPANRSHEAAASGNAGVVVVAQLLGLLLVFIGEPLTMRLVRDAWPGLPSDAMDRQLGEQQ